MRESLQKTPFDAADDETSAESRTRPLLEKAVPDVATAAPDETLPSMSLDPMGSGPELAETVVDERAAEDRTQPSTLRIGRYEIRDVLGGGGQGVVYKALQRGAVEQTVAIKTLRAEGLAAEGDVAKFLQEMRLMTALDHPGLVSILDSGIEDGRPFLAMPLLAGGSLTSRLKDGALPDPKTAARWMAEIARAVQYLHDKNMVHRDLKPSNIRFLIIDGQPMSPLTLVYALLIAASALWSRARVVTFTTVLAMIGYVVLIAEGWAYGKPIGFRYGHLDFLVGLALMGFITAYQARRVRALGGLIEEEEEPST